MPEITYSTGAVPEPVATDRPGHEKLRKAAESHDRQIVADAEASRTPISDCEKRADSRHRGDAVWHTQVCLSWEKPPCPLRNRFR